MSDFVFTKLNRPSGLLAKQLQRIYQEGVPEVFEIHGAWGSLAVTRNLHYGFAPVETEVYLCVIIGGPVLTFTDNRFLAGTDLTFGTRLVLNRWNSSEGIKWDDNLSGPFVALRLDKVRGKLEVVTDLMSFIPVFQSEGLGDTVIGTHVDVVARVAECDKVRDPVSIADFVLHGVVTYPYTFYPGVKQVPPASVHQWAPNDNGAHSQSCPYWQPLEKNPYRTIDEAAESLREGLQAYVNAVTDGMDGVALFMSGGEDSRTVLGMIPGRCERDGITFLDSMSREGRVAQAAAAAYGANSKMCLRDEMRYLDVLPPCSDLVGTGSEYMHVHTYGFHISAKLKHYRAVFGGYLSDTLLKGSDVNRNPILKSLSFLPFLPFMKSRNATRRPIERFKFLPNDVLQDLKHRIEIHEQLVDTFRADSSAQEWYSIWPSSMHKSIPNLYGNRRLFPSYEPFMAGCSVKVSAAVPQSWKLNRRFFQRMAKPYLKPTRYLPHTLGFLPYYPWYINILIHGVAWARHQFEYRMGWTKAEQGPWTDWRAIRASTDWKEAVDSRIASALLPEGLFTVSLRALFEGEQLSWNQKINLMQVLYQMSDREAQ